jgi:dihydrofolate reductase
MFSPIVTQIAIISENRVLANTKLSNKSGIPWKIKNDLKRFKEITSRHPVIMGRNTYEAMGKPLPNRTNIIITHNPNYEATGSVVVTSIQEALDWARTTETEEIFIVGGGKIYTEALSFTDRLYLTIVEEECEGDIFFPEYTEFTNILSQEFHQEEGLKYQFINLSR